MKEIIMNKDTCILGIFKDETLLMSAVKKVRSNGVKIQEVFSPFPIHGIEDAAGLKKTRLYAAALIFGIIGVSSVLYFLWWATVKSYPLIYGGKPLYTLPSHIVLAFVLTINVASGLSVIAFFFANRFYPGKKPELVHPGVVDDLFIVAIEKPQDADEAGNINNMLKENGAVEVREQNV
ncbi:MAG: DUF3341 domain-containing protein [Flavobacteriales bacterium]